jgi:D-alanyl-D-alanine carboxypeptidase
MNLQWSLNSIPIRNKFFPEEIVIKEILLSVICTNLLSTPAMAGSATLEQIRSEYGLPALATGVIRNGMISVDTVGVRKLGDSTLASDRDQWHLGSNGKAITATLGAVLVEKGAVSWDTTLADVFRDIPIHPGYRHITLKELFAHRAGVHADIATFAGGEYWRKFNQRGVDHRGLREEFTRAVLAAPPETDGSHLVYSNAGYLVAAQMLTRLTGQDWETLVLRQIFAPLGMSTCGFGAAGSESTEHPTQPWPHSSFLGSTLTPVSPASEVADNPVAIGPAGTIHCSISDWLKFAKTHIDGFNGANTPILTAQGFKFLHQDYKGQGYTSGGFIFKRRKDKVYLGHNGSNSMNFAFLVIDPSENSAYVAATNRGDRNGEKGAQTAMIINGSPDVCVGNFCLLTK